MNLTQAKAHVGKLVMSHDAGEKLLPALSLAHGPYRLVRMTKGGQALLEGHAGFPVGPSLLEPYVPAQGADAALLAKCVLCGAVTAVDLCCDLESLRSMAATGRAIFAVTREQAKWGWSHSPQCGCVPKLRLVA